MQQKIFFVLFLVVLSIGFMEGLPKVNDFGKNYFLDKFNIKILVAKRRKVF
jgi:hypothetical protein